MADTTSLTSFLDDVASAIKYKKGDNTAIPAANFDTEIRNLPSQGTYEEKSVTITQNGTQNVVPDSGYDALSRVSITTAVPEKQLQTKSSTITDNGTIELHPDTGYDGFDQVNLTINVSGGGDVPVKLFDSIAAMNSSSGNQLGDLALVYANETRNMIATDQFSKVMFPQTVINVNRETYGNPQFRAVNGSNYFDAQGDLTRNRFYMNFYLSSGQVRVDYTSSDGYTYTRTTLTGPTGMISGDVVDFGFDIEFTHPNWWGNGQLGYFFQMVNRHFDGLFTYKNIVTSDVYPLDLSLSTNSSNLVYSSTVVHESDINEMLEALADFNGNITSSSDYNCFITANDDFSIYHIFCEKYYSDPDTEDDPFSAGNSYCPQYIWNKSGTIYIANSEYAYHRRLKVFEYNISTGIITNITNTTQLRSTSYEEQATTDKYFICKRIRNNNTTSLQWYDSSWTQQSYWSIVNNYYDYDGWAYAETQLTLDNANQLLPGVLGYGSNGLITGDNTVYDNIPMTMSFNKMYGVPTDTSTNRMNTIPYTNLGFTEYTENHSDTKIRYISDSTLNDFDGLIGVPTNDFNDGIQKTVDGRYGVYRDTTASNYKYIFKDLTNDIELNSITFTNNSASTIYVYDGKALLTYSEYTYGQAGSTAQTRVRAYIYDMANNRQYANVTWTMTAALTSNQYYSREICGTYCPYKDFALVITEQATTENSTGGNRSYVIAGQKLSQLSNGMSINKKITGVTTKMFFSVMYTNKDSVLVFSQTRYYNSYYYYSRRV